MNEFLRVLVVLSLTLLTAKFFVIGLRRQQEAFFMDDDSRGFKVYHCFLGFYQGMFDGNLQWTKVNQVAGAGYFGSVMDAPPVRFPNAQEAAKFIELISSEEWKNHPIPAERLSITPYLTVEQEA
jgi:hypothetical protein